MAEVRMLKNRKTGDLLPYNADVARHPDMDVVTPDGVAPRKGRSAPASKRKKKAGPAKPSAARRASKTSEDTTPPSAEAPTGDASEEFKTPPADPNDLDLSDMDLSDLDDEPDA
jgi:hypothetical protein